MKGRSTKVPERKKEMANPMEPALKSSLCLLVLLTCSMLSHGFTQGVLRDRWYVESRAGNRIKNLAMQIYLWGFVPSGNTAFSVLPLLPFI
jgi:hypothetical protein